MRTIEAEKIARNEALFREVASTRRELYGPSFSLAADLLQHGRMLNQLGRPAEALKVVNEARSMAIATSGQQARCSSLSTLPVLKRCFGSIESPKRRPC